MSAGKQPGNTQVLVFEIAEANLGTGSVSVPTAPGAFQLFSGTPTNPAVARFLYQKTNASCVTVASTGSTNGTVTITSLSGGAFTGSAGLVTLAGDPIGATFAAASCPALGPLLAAPSPPPCQ